MHNVIPLLASVALVVMPGPAAAATLPIPPPGQPVNDTGEADPVRDVLSESDDSTAQPASAGEHLEGLFRLAAGECSADGANGSWFQMRDPGGGPVNNGDSPCNDSSITPLTPGADGGLLTTDYQEQPDPAFAGGDALADRITQPTPFFGNDFSAATNPVDPQTGTEVPVPVIRHDGAGALSGDLRGFAASWNRQHFNQGAPKPDGSTPDGTEVPVGTYDPATGAYTLQWSSRIVGGPFNGFTGIWHLEGTFESAINVSPSSNPETTSEPAGQTDTPAPATRASASSTGPSTPEGGPSASQPRELARTGPATDLGILALAAAAAGTLLRRRGAAR